ncbi:MAG: ribosome maturation factor RimM [Pyrinomonadaceae bacterium]
MNSDFIAIAKVIKPRGLRGEVSAELLTDFPERFENLDKVFLVFPDGKQRETKIEEFRFHKNRVLLFFKDIATIDAAEMLRCALVCIEEREAVELENDEYFDWQLIGCEVFGTEGKLLGTVTDLFRAAENENLVVAGGTKEYLIPFAKAICVSVDIENKRIEIDPPEGLLEF